MTRDGDDDDQETAPRRGAVAWDERPVKKRGARGDVEREGTRRTAVRVLALLERTRAPRSVRDLADAFGVSKQTIERILADLGTVYPVVEEPDPHHVQRRLYRLRRGPDGVARDARARATRVVLRVRADGVDGVRATPWFRGAAECGDGAVRVHVELPVEEVFRIVLAHVPHVRIEAPAELDRALRELVARVWDE